MIIGDSKLGDRDYKGQPKGPSLLKHHITVYAL